MLFATGSVTVALTLTDSACRVVGDPSVEEDKCVGETSTSVWVGLGSRTVLLGMVVAATLMGTGT